MLDTFLFSSMPKHKNKSKKHAFSGSYKFVCNHFCENVHCAIKLLIAFSNTVICPIKIFHMPVLHYCSHSRCTNTGKI